MFCWWPKKLWLSSPLWLQSPQLVLADDVSADDQSTVAWLFASSWQTICSADDQSVPSPPLVFANDIFCWLPMFSCMVNRPIFWHTISYVSIDDYMIMFSILDSSYMPVSAATLVWKPPFLSLCFNIFSVSFFCKKATPTWPWILAEAGG